MTTEDAPYHGRLESLVERQQATLEDQEQVIRKLRETIEDQRAVIDALEGPHAFAEDGVDLSVTRRGALTAGGVLALVFGGVGTATASVDPTGQIGTESRPLDTLHTAGLTGPLTGGTKLTSLVGDGLTVDETGALTAETGSASEPNTSAPDDLQAVLDDMEQDTYGVYRITTDHELQAIQADLSADYRLATDIDASETGGWNGGDGFDPIGANGNGFAGTLEGDGHVITGLWIDRGGEDYVGLFGVTDSGATISSLGLENLDVTGTDDVGGLVGENNGTVESSHVIGSVDGNKHVGGLVGFNEGLVESSYATVTVAGSYYVGGLVGWNDSGTIDSSYASGSVVRVDSMGGGLVGYNSLSGTVNRSYTTGGVDGGDLVGGLVGENHGAVESSYATGSVSGDAVMGGLVGYNAGTVGSSYWDTESTGQSSSAGGSGTGLSTAEMQGTEAEDKMSALDFENVWVTVDASNDADVSADSYPILQALDQATQLEARA